MKGDRVVRAYPTFAVLVALTLPSVGCQVPRFEGPEIQEPPPNFQRQPDNETVWPVFPEHEVSYHSGWVHTDLGGVSIIYIDEYPVVFGMEEIVAARAAAEATEPDRDAIYGELEALTIDGRDAWGWYRRVESPRRGLDQVTYTAIVPYDSVSYALRFDSGEPSLKRAAPDTLRAVLSTFGIGRTTYDLPLIAIAFGAMLLFVSLLRARSKERAARLRSINLVTIEREAEDEEEAAAGAQEELRESSTPTGERPGS